MKNSRRVILTALIGLFSLQLGFAQQTKIAVAIAVGKSSCGTNNDLGYVFKYGTDTKANYYSMAQNEAAKTYPSNFKVAVEKNGYNGDKGSYLVIIETKTKYNDCNITTFGVGFGDNYEIALRQAKLNLGNRVGLWQENKHGYDVRVSQKL